MVEKRTPEYCRERARHARLLTAETDDVGMRADLQDIAQDWDRLAKYAERQRAKLLRLCRWAA
jgi:hypothetical protein